MKPMLAALLVLPSLVSAADLPVRYTVQDKPLKAAIAGTSLTFQLFSDPACTNPPAYSTAVLIENVTLITKLKQFTPKNDAKLPNTDELSVTLPGVTTGGNLYLKVTGTGVVPVGGACQAQAAQVVAPNCVDNIRNQGETDVDCGGPTTCLRCAAGKTCAGGVCASCTDSIQNDGETDVDCGGSNACPRCADGLNCVVAADCQSSRCVMARCQTPTCTDIVKNGGESDVDCGGATVCPRCTAGRTCLANSDCTSSICSLGLCQ